MYARTNFKRAGVLPATLTILAACLVAAVSCQDSTRSVGARSVTIVRESGFIREIGDVMQLRAEALDAGGGTIAGAAVRWTSSDSSVVAVSPDGLVTARGYGTALVTGQVDDAKATYAVTVPKITSFFVLDKVEIGIADTTMLRATVTYSDGPGGWSHGATWTVRDTSLVSVDASGRMVGKGRVGNTIVVASIDGFVDSTLVVVWNPGFYIWPDTSLVPAGATRGLRVQQFAASSGVLTLSDAAWSSSDPAVASVDASGLVTAGQAGHATIVATRDGQRAVAEVYVPSYDHRFSFSSVNVEISSTCALDNGAEYCWGDLGQMLDGAPQADRCEVVSSPQPRGGVSRDWRRCAGSPVAVPTTLRFTSLFKGHLALTADGTLYSLGPSGPKEASPGYHFRQASGGWQTCAVALDDTGYCWGSNWDGLLGIGTAQSLGPYPTTPQRVSGDIRWSMIESSWFGTCGLSVGGKAYCWGANRNFRFGVGPDSTTRDGCTGPCLLVPTAVLTDAVFTTMASRTDDTCALTAEGSVYCWGIASAALPPSAAGVPVLVRTAPVLRSLTTSQSDVCGVSDDGGVYCLRRDPTATDPSALYSFVRQPLPFAVRGLTMGELSSCAFAVSDGRLYCWGAGVRGLLGDGRFMNAPVESPALVANQ